MSDAGDQSKAAIMQSGIREDLDVQNLSVETLTKDSANRDKMSNEAILPSDQNNAEALLVNEIVAENTIIQDSSEALAKTQSEDVLTTNENNEVTVTVEDDVINNVKSDVSNTVQLDDISTLALIATPADVSVTLEMEDNVNLGEANTGAIITEGEQSFAMETASLTNYNIITDTTSCDADVIAANDNEFCQFTNQEASIIGKSVVDQAKKNEEITSESQASNELQNNFIVPNELQGNSNSQQSEVPEDEELFDILFSQPLVPQLSEVVRVGVVARVPEDDKPVVNNHVSNIENEGSDTDKNVIE